MPDAILEHAREEPVLSGAGSHALVPLTLRASQAAPKSLRPDARFVAHLIATATFAPQTRTLRRAAPGDGANSYLDASRRGGRFAAASRLVLSLVA